MASTSEDDNLRCQQMEFRDPSPESTATQPAPAKVEESLIDLLSGNNFFQPKSDEKVMEIVLYEPNHTVSSQQVSSLTDMFGDLLSSDPNENYESTSYNSQNPTPLPKEVLSTVNAKRNLPDQHLPESIPWHVEPTVHANIYLPDQHLSQTVPLHEESIVHANRNAPDWLQPETMSWQLEPTFYTNGGNLNSMAWMNRDPQIQMNNASNQWNHTIGMLYLT